MNGGHGANSAFAHPTNVYPSSTQNVGWAKSIARANPRAMTCPPLLEAHDWWARRRCAFAHPTKLRARKRRPSRPPPSSFPYPLLTEMHPSILAAEGGAGLTGKPLG